MKVGAYIDASGLAHVGFRKDSVAPRKKQNALLNVRAGTKTPLSFRALVGPPSGDTGS